MGDLHSIAYSGDLYSSSLGWDFHNLGVFNADMSRFMDSTPTCLSPLDSDGSGYLQDALVEFSSKRQRFLFSSDGQTNESTDPIKSCWNLNCNENSTEKFCYVSEINDKSNHITGETMNNNSSRSGVSETETILTETQTLLEEAVVSAASEVFDSSSVNMQFLSDKENQHPIDPYGGGEKRKKRVIIRGVVYPFAVVKPGGIEGDVTLEDINKRIVMPPTRPVRHPVGEFACRPTVHPDGTSLSGKAVVALTRIQTQGRGTITIIRTKD